MIRSYRPSVVSVFSSREGIQCFKYRHSHERGDLVNLFGGLNREMSLKNS